MAWIALRRAPRRGAERSAPAFFGLVGGFVLPGSCSVSTSRSRTSRIPFPLTSDSTMALAAMRLWSRSLCARRCVSTRSRAWRCVGPRAWVAAGGRGHLFGGFPWACSLHAAARLPAFRSPSRRRVRGVVRVLASPPLSPACDLAWRSASSAALGDSTRGELASASGLGAPARPGERASRSCSFL